jgi:predicted ribosome quality control (RQC) complex YloA/Tae2 family protein
MLLRKYLTGGNIVSIGSVNCDRVVRIEFEARNELKDSVRFSLIAELMGRHSTLSL